jgi:hypothetical protein
MSVHRILLPQTYIRQGDDSSGMDKNKLGGGLANLLKI